MCRFSLSSVLSGADQSGRSEMRTIHQNPRRVYDWHELERDENGHCANTKCSTDLCTCRYRHQHFRHDGGISETDIITGASS